MKQDDLRLLIKVVLPGMVSEVDKPNCGMPEKSKVTSK